MPFLKDVSKVQIFLSMIAYVRGFIASYNKLIVTLTEILESKRLFDWTSTPDATFQAQESSHLCPILQFPNSKTKYKLGTENLDYAIEGVLHMTPWAGYCSQLSKILKKSAPSNNFTSF